MSKKKQRELQLIESLIKLAPLPGYHIVEQRESPDALIEGPKKELIGLEITEYEQHGGKPFKRYQVERFWEETPLLTKFVKRIRLKKLKGIVSLLWEASNISGGWFAISGKDLMSIINEKEKKLDSYRNALPNFKQWLLIGAIGDSVWRMIYFKDIVVYAAQQVAKEISQSGFDQIWFVDMRGEWVVRLK